MKPRVLVAMSGGVDSSVAAVLLHKEGYEVIGLTMKTWDYAHSAPRRAGKEVGCCTLESMNDARQVALRYGFAHFVVDIRKEFGDWVIERFTDEYLAGRTPNPCVLCNTHIKWDALLRRADDLGCAFMATGHYARVRQENGRWVLSSGRDLNKDQSYALWGLPQAHLARTLFPLGHYEKPAIRQMAHQYGLEAVAAKPDSYEICFIPDNDYRRFLSDRVEGLSAQVAGGPMVLSDGTEVGRHEGYPFYTIGQRRGLRIALGYPAYVTAIDPGTNTITVGPRSDLMQQTLMAREINLIKYPDLCEERPAFGKIRYKDPGAPCLVRQTPDDELVVDFTRPRSAITPGQSMVLYEGADVLGGGWIHSVAERSDVHATASTATA
ncbi:MAG: tRNA 2-thiouridine(34) synthase MnmA [Bacteroidota bacterium]|nr:tRNA 2-thiouridine(34) synthase MnmA [Bacteroidota bacterium]MDE2955602.1 tRNA 2-thiouridine(34) synthase MnmA [Bacteroidota bacterium]